MSSKPRWQTIKNPDGAYYPSEYKLKLDKFICVCRIDPIYASLSHNVRLTISCLDIYDQYFSLFEKEFTFHKLTTQDILNRMIVEISCILYDHLHNIVKGIHNLELKL